MSLTADALYGALVGLARACKNGVATQNTPRALVRALALPDGADETALRAALEAVRAEKHAVAPNCADCPSPCGATDDYDMALVSAAEADIRETKRALLAELRAAARALSARPEKEAATDGGALLDGLENLGYDVDAQTLREALRRARDFREQCEDAKGGRGAC